MSTILDFTIPLIPTAQMRPRSTTIAGHATVYKCAKQKANEHSIELYLMQYKPEKPFDCPCALSVYAFFPIPKSVTKKNRLQMEAGHYPVIKKPDIDNLAKQIMDAMTRLQFWTDDSLVYSMSFIKFYAKAGDIPHWRVCLFAKS